MVKDNSLESVCVLSGPRDRLEVELGRAKVAVDYIRKHGLDVPVRILGAGPDLTEVLAYTNLLNEGNITSERYKQLTSGLNHHLRLYEYLKDNLGESAIETVTSSVTLVQNILYGFGGSGLGRHGIATEPWHYQKVEQIAHNLKRKGRINPDLEFFNIASPDIGYYGPVQKILSGLKTRIELSRVKSDPAPSFY